MIHYIKGKIATKMPGKIVVENNGVGFLIYIADSSPLFYAKEDEEVTVYREEEFKKRNMSLNKIPSLETSDDAAGVEDEEQLLAL